MKTLAATPCLAMLTACATLAPGLTKAEVLKALEGGKALRAASRAFRDAR